MANDTFPYFCLHIQAPPNLYDLKLYADMRKFHFKPELEEPMLESIRVFLFEKFNKMQASTRPETVNYESNSVEAAIFNMLNRKRTELPNQK